MVIDHEISGYLILRQIYQSCRIYCVYIIYIIYILYIIYIYTVYIYIIYTVYIYIYIFLCMQKYFVLPLHSSFWLVKVGDILILVVEARFVNELSKLMSHGCYNMGKH